MSLIPQISDPYIGAFAGGLLYGLGVCTASCLPVVAGYIAGVGSGFFQSVKITLIFSFGRILAYSLIGALIGSFSGLLHLFVAEQFISPFQMYSSVTFGVVTSLIGGYLIYKALRGGNCSVQINNQAANAKNKYGVNFGALTLGLTRGLVLCPPLILLLVYSLTFASPLGSIGIAMLFGLGTVISPILFLGGVTGWLFSKAPLFRKWIAVGGGSVLVMLGLITMISSFSELS
ncbi:MAG: sulfite exporter TauE/SafE family protein [Candidatus Bathyarchaeota archaeon]|nr:sulfite exporter TauE/SafE family protein [Candidatus Bathyarchaeota archaeon]MDT8782029.1 sulfite exporter TauE/SafE family protein [Candidatus Bathyarchaeota archaeon]NLD66601.1 sulfite exporter TauE/SafE family protein [Thermoproteota archaeon]